MGYRQICFHFNFPLRCGNVVSMLLSIRLKMAMHFLKKVTENDDS